MGVKGINRKKECIEKGHEVIVRNNGKRHCKTCRRVTEARRRVANRLELREYHRMWDEGKRRRDGEKETPGRVGKGTIEPRPAEPRWHRGMPIEPIANWLEQRSKEWFAEWGEDPKGNTTHWMRVSRMLKVSDRILRRLMYQDGGQYADEQNSVHLDTIDRMLTEAGETHALELMYPLEGLRETADYTTVQNKNRRKR